MEMLRKFTIAQRISMLVILVLIGLVLQSTTSLYKQYDALIDQQYTKVKQLVQSSQSILKHYHQLSQQGKLTEEQAKEQAKAAIQSLRYSQNDYFWINDFEPKMLMHPIKPSLNGKNVGGVKDSNGVPLFLEIVKVAKRNGEGFVKYLWPKPGADKPVEKISYVKEFAPWQWIIGTGVYLDNVDQIFATQRNGIIFRTIIFILLISALSYVIAKSILVPTRDAAELMKDIAQGEGDLTKQLDTKGNDEVSNLSEYFNQFISKMRDSLGDVLQNSSRVMDQANALSDTSQTNSELIQLQRDNTTQVATAMEQMTSNIREVSENAEAARQAAQDAKVNATGGKQVINSTIDQIGSLSNNIDDVSEVITKLANESDSIGAVLDVIRGIAEQTNLLALNAAIEAARAGEQGRGFAVVADEVRTLASRTGQSTEEIQQMIQRLQSGAQEAVTAVKTSKDASQTTVEQVGKADASLNEIERLIEVISDMTDHIAQATEQQTQAADEINLRLNELSTMTEEAVSHTDQLASASIELQSNSSDMSEIVSRFKL